MMDVLRALYHWKEVVRSTAAVVRAVHASTVLQGTQRDEENQYHVILCELEGSHEKIEFMTREDVEPLVASKPKEHHSVRSAAPLQRSAAPLQGQEHQNKEFVSPLSSSRVGRMRQQRCMLRSKPPLSLHWP